MVEDGRGHAGLATSHKMKRSRHSVNPSFDAMRDSNYQVSATTAQVSRQVSRGAERNESNEMSRILSQTAKGVIPRLNLPQKGLHKHRTSYAGVTNTDRTDRRPLDSNENDSSRLSSEGPSRHLHTYKSAT